MVSDRFRRLFVAGLIAVSAGLAGCGKGATPLTEPVIANDVAAAEAKLTQSLASQINILKRRSFTQTGKTLVRATIASKAQAQKLADSGADILGDGGKDLLVQARAEDLQLMKALGIKVQMISPKEGMTVENKFDPRYHTYEELTSELQGLAKSYPELIKLSSIGKAFENKRELWAVHMTGKRDQGQAVGTRPGVLLVGMHHARELVTAEFVFLAIKHLAEQYGKDAELTQLLDTRELFIVPMLNPDGHAHAVKGENWRKNTNGQGTDLNRNYGHHWGEGGASSSPSSDTYRGKTAFSEPETRALRDYAKAHNNIKVGMSYHSFSNLILYPWGYTENPTPDAPTFVAMGQKFAGFSGYTPQQIPDLYIASGGTDDWMYATHGIFFFTSEIGTWGDYFDPPYDKMTQFWNENWPGVKYMLQVAPDPKKLAQG